MTVKARSSRRELFPARQMRVAFLLFLFSSPCVNGALLVRLALSA